MGQLNLTIMTLMISSYLFWNDLTPEAEDQPRVYIDTSYSEFVNIVDAYAEAQHRGYRYF